MTDEESTKQHNQGAFEPPHAVKTVRELIFWEYAHLIAKAAGFEGNYRFIMSRFQRLRQGKMKMSGLVRDDRMMLSCERCCIYCGSAENLSLDHIIPLSKGGPDIISNQVYACRSCNSSKGDKDIFYWFGLERKEEIPPMVLSKYLKLVFDFHEAQGTLDKTDINMDGKLDVMDLSVFHQ
ncbi:MAG: HNH endonuclease [Methanoregula sp.]|nr:HNH endonuclease [Methanoregula sp.]